MRGCCPSAWKSQVVPHFGAPIPRKSTLIDDFNFGRAETTQEARIRTCRSSALQWNREIIDTSIGRINTLFSLFHQEKKEIHDAVQPWGMRNLTDFRQHAQYCSFPPVRPAKFQPPGMPTTCRGSCQLTSTRVSFGLRSQPVDATSKL